MNADIFKTALMEESKKDQVDMIAPIDPKDPLVQELKQWD